MTTTTISRQDERLFTYFLDVAPLNRFVIAHADWPPYAEMPAFCRELAQIEEAFATALKAYPRWGDAQDEVDAQAVVLAQEATVDYQCAKAPGTLAAQLPLTKERNDLVNRSNEAAAATRLAIGMTQDR